MSQLFLQQLGLTDSIASLSVWLNQHALRIGIILLAGLVIQQIIHLISRRIKATIHRQSEGTAADRANRARTLTGVFSAFASALVWSIAILMILDQMGINIGPLITSAGVIGFAIGFGSQELVKDVISGFFFLYENQFNVGDYIKVKDFQGEVREMNLRTVRLKGPNNERIIMRNSQIDVVTKLPKPPIVEDKSRAKA